MKRLFSMFLGMLPAFGLGLAVGYAVFAMHAEGGSAKKASAHGATATSSSSKTAAIQAASRVQWNPDTPLAQVLKMPDSGERNLELTLLVANTPADKLAGLIDQAMKNPTGESGELLQYAYAKWAASDPEAALTHAQATAARKNDAGYLDPVLKTWAAHDPQNAFAAVMKMDRTQFRISAVSAVLTTWAQTDDPLGAVSALNHLPPGSVPDYIYHPVYEAWSHRDPAAALANLDKINSDDTRRDVRGYIIRDMATMDPAHALDVLHSFPAGQQSPQLYGELYSSWAAQNPGAALSSAQNLPMGAARVQAIQSVIGNWAETDPAGALKAAQSFPASPEREQAIQASVSRLAQQDPEAAAKYATDAPAGATHNALIRNVATSWAETDPAAALQWLDKNVSGPAYNQSLLPVMDRLSKADPNAAIAYITQMQDNPQRDNLIQTTLGNWARFGDSNAALTWANDNLTGATRDNAVNSVLNRLVDENPMAAASYVAQMPDSPSRNNLVQNMAQTLAATDINSAVAWLEKLPADIPAATRTQAQQQILGVWINSDPASAASYVQNMADDPNFGRLSAQVSATWARSDPQAALEWAGTLPAGSAHDTAVNNSLVNLAHYDPASAWSYAQKTGDPAQLASVVSSWAQSAPGAAAKAATTLPEGDQRVNAVGNVANAWINQDPLAASQWINTLAVSPERDAAVTRLVTSQATNDPSSAMNWAATISNDGTRYSQILNVARQWARRDANAAATALLNAPLTPDQRNAALQAISTQPTGK